MTWPTRTFEIQNATSGSGLAPSPTHQVNLGRANKHRAALAADRSGNPPRRPRYNDALMPPARDPVDRLTDLAKEQRMATGTVKWFNSTKGFGFILIFIWVEVVFVKLCVVLC
jgi:hypothetical protein